MLSKNKDVLLLIDQIQKEKLLKNLIRQINKDAGLVGIEFDILENSTAQNVVTGLQNLLVDLIRNNFSAYSNFLYRIDVSEDQILELQDLEINILSEKVTILILQKECQKVYFKNRNQ
jgi:hypothetical protein